MSLNRLLVTLVRHGESQDNQHGIWAGFRDTPLTSNGISQARALGQSFANVPLTAIYCSDLKRAAMTADEILKSNRSIPPPPLVQSKSLREINFGQAEGQSYASAEWMQSSTGENARSFRFPQGESLQEVNARIAKAVRQFILPRVEALRKKPPSQVAASGDVGHICIVAHGIAIAELLRVFMALHIHSPSSPWSDPRASYQRVRLENTGWSRLELAVPFQGEGDHPNDASINVNTIPSQPATATSGPLGRSETQSGYTDFGEVQTDLVQGPTDDALADQHISISPARSGAAAIRSTPLQAESSARPIYVRILCQNQTDHLRAFNLQQSSTSSAAKSVAHLAGGGASKTSTGNSPAPSAALQHQNSSASTSAATVGLPPSATLASIASNAASSNSHPNTSMTPSTPAPSSTLHNNGATRSITTTPASARSLSAYDSRMMARELERASAASMLAGSEAGTSSAAGGTYYPPSNSTSTMASERQGSIAGFNSSVGNGSNSAPDRNAFTASPAAGGTLGSAQASSSQSASSATPNPSLFVAAYPPSASTTSPNATSPNPAGVNFPVGPGTSSDTWQMICIRVLPLFNGEALRTSIEELNEMVSLHVRKTLERSQAHAIESLTLDLISLTSTGTLTLNSKLQGLEDSRLLLRLVEVWTFFLGQVLPYCEGCFLPLQTDPTLRSLISSSASYGGGTGSAGAGAGANSSSTGLFSSNANLNQSGVAMLLSRAAKAGPDLQRIDVRKIVLVVFRDQVLMPIYERLFYLFAHLSELDPAFSAAEDTTTTGGGGGGGDDGIKQVSLRLLQMISVLASILSDDDAQEAMDNLLRALRLGSKSASAGRSRGAGDGPGARFTSPTQKNHRRGWMSQKARKHGAALGLDVGAGKGSTPFGPSSTLGNVSGMLPSTQSDSDGFGNIPQRAYLTRPGHLTNLKDPLGPRFDADMTEDEYLTSLRSPAGSPAISTPGNADAPPTPIVDQANSPSSAMFDTAGP